MGKIKKGDFGYLKYRKTVSFIIMMVGIAIVLSVFILGIIINKTRNNPFTVAAAVLTLPAAKFAVAFFTVISHKSASKELKNELEKINTDGLGMCFDCIFSNNKVPIGVQAVVIAEAAVVAFTEEKNADEDLFKKSVKEFMQNDGCNVNVFLCKNKNEFFSKVKYLSENVKNKDEMSSRTERNMRSMKSMCL